MLSPGPGGLFNLHLARARNESRGVKSAGAANSAKAKAIEKKRQAFAQWLGKHPGASRKEASDWIKEKLNVTGETAAGHLKHWAEGHNFLRKPRN